MMEVRVYVKSHYTMGLLGDAMALYGILGKKFSKR